MAGALDATWQTINAIETRRFDPSLPLGFRAAGIFALRIEEILHDDDRRSLATRL